ncbi:hypothetical protein F5887DRAFT_940337 [Amanita rubescens]|nr:hypothetical protein F5887DRAFT_940337 [Amanita rubescens]
MLRLSRPRTLLRLRRSLVSSVLLNRSWDKASIADLRAEAKSRGLPVKGNKATIIARLQNFDSNLARSPEPSARSASTEAATPHTKSFPPLAGLAPGIPSNSNQRSLAEPSFNIKLPNLTRPDPVRPVQIVVGDASAFHGGGPIWSDSESLSESATAEPPLPDKEGIFS